MEKNSEIEKSISFGHSITINERKNIVISGIKKLNGFDNSEFFMDTVMGALVIKGDKLELVSLDTYSGKITIKGLVLSLAYLDGEKKLNKESFLSRLFK
jgi:sporulation protein YabP